MRSRTDFAGKSDHQTVAVAPACYCRFRFKSCSFQYLAGCTATPSIGWGAPGEEPARANPFEQADGSLRSRRVPVRNNPMQFQRVTPHVTDALDATIGWGDVPIEDRPLWSHYMIDHKPWFPGSNAMAHMAPARRKNGHRAPKDWKQTAQELHQAGFTPANYYLLAELLTSPRFQAELNEAEHSHLFKSWFGVRMEFRLAAEEWEPWLERLAKGESPRRALQHMLKGDVLPPIASFVPTSPGVAFTISAND